MTRRVYLPLGRDGLAALAKTGESGAPAYAVTAAVRAEQPRADEEDLEYDALWIAAEDPASSTGGPRIVLVAADLPDAAVTEPPERADAYRVALAGPVRRRDVVALHVADADAGEDDELSWYDVTELDAVLADLEG